MTDSCDSMDCSPPGSSVHGISQARILEWVAISFSRGSSYPGMESRSPALAGGLFASEPPGYLIIIDKVRHGRAVRGAESRIPLSNNCKDSIINSVQRHSLFNHLIPSSEAFSPTAATESTREISSCITKLQECPINFHHVICFGDHSKTTNIILSTGNQCRLPPLLAASLVQLPLISWLNILHQETSGKLITKTFEGRHEELPVLSKKACGATFTMHPDREETSLQPGRGWNKMKT